jgi:carbonic anhydrase
MRKAFSAVLLLLAVCAFADGPTCPATWNYQHQELWRGDCQSGVRQSPVDLKGATPAAPTRLALHYNPIRYVVRNTSRTVKVEAAASGGYVEYEGVRYDLVEIHYHAPAEHTIGPERDVMEEHIVHKRRGGNDYLVIGVFFTPGTSGEALHNIIRMIPRVCDVASNATTFKPVGELLKWGDKNAWWTYDGSLTTPDCTPAVKFIILKQTMQISADDLKRLHDNFGDNERKPQKALPVKVEPEH